MTAITLSIRIPDAENIEKSFVIISAKSDDEGAKPVLETGRFSQITHLARQTVEDALAQTKANTLLLEDKPPACDDACALPEEKEDSSGEGQLTLLSFDF